LGQSRQPPLFPVEDGKTGAIHPIAENLNIDDFAFDDSGSVYLTAHVYQSVVKFDLEDEKRTTVAGGPEERVVAGTTAAEFGRGEGDKETLYVTTTDLSCIFKLSQPTDRLSGAPKGSRKWKKYQEALRRLRNEKQRQRDLLLRDIIERYNKEQPVIDSERQLSGKVVDEDVRSALERSDYMSPEQLLLIDAILTLPETSLEKECQRR
jgi:hypothetical protein